ncbi:MAG: 50S ribosomal protein L29 [Calditrichaeota bacterium]|nr:50S ribosomal protein L29 [Calditrichota bacterium]MCB9366220.1 50S ribosomal protein L29 [Calditrichota bacterium]MCB9391711.1 50S ribosomal protein L29 [Calditrichota bacterium]
MATSSARPARMTELKELTAADLQNRLLDAEDNLEALRFQLDAGQLPNTARVRAMRRDIARIRTVIREHELGLRAEKGKVK